MKTQVKEDTFKGSKMFVVEEVKEDAGRFPAARVAFGVKKARMILDNVDELKKFVEANEK